MMIGLKIPIHGPFEGDFEVKIGVTGNFCSFIPHRNATTRD